MKLIAGLGNPGKEYQHTRHNVGFMAIDTFSTQYGDVGWEHNDQARAFLKKLIFGHVVALCVQPLTYMNESGKTIAHLLRFYKMNAASDLLVIHDEIDLPLGVWKHSSNVSSAGHNGVQSIINALNTQEFQRLRLGIETRVDKKIPPAENFVLQRFSPEEQEKLDRVIEEIMPEIKKFVDN